ncbi:MAG: hypothetical protein NVS4B3_15460 [Gemmatimonadaceae bacterium]
MTDSPSPGSALTMPEITCARCGKVSVGFERAPFPGPLAARIVSQICRSCWGDWLKQQTMLINHYGLNVMDAQARGFLTKNMEAFLFREEGEEDVDTSKKGSIAW